ncbi:zinc homeostasis factor 1 [Zopfochytrium polystomum]|nr:zinc homeostasis factor 1 [Zopfochytrium polystomum]
MQNNPANGAHAHFDRPEQPLRDDRQLRSASHLRDREGDHGQTLTHDHHHDHDHDHDQHHDSFAHGHDHGHGDHATGTNAAADGRERRIVFVACLTGAFFLVEIITGYVANSIALIADSFHMLSDIIALFIALYAIKLAKRTDRKPNFTFGYQRAEILGAFANSVFLLALCLTIIIEAIQRFVQPAEIDNPILVLIVGSLGLAMNIVGLFLFREGHGHSHGGSAGHSHAHGQAAQIPAGSSKAMKPILPTTNYSAKTRATIIAKADSMRNSHFSDESPLPSPAASHRDGHGHDEEKKSRRSEGHMNMKGIFLHLAGDALGSIGVIFSALLIKFGSGEWRFYMDPVVSLIISALIISSTLPLIKSAAFILLQGVPASVEIDRLKREILKLPGIVDVHEFHVWGLSDSKSVASVHIMVSEPVPWFPGSDSSGKFGHDDAPPPSYMEIATSVKRLLHSYGVHSTTVQPEFCARSSAQR